MKTIGRVILALASVVAAFSQGAPAPYAKLQFFNNSGQPLSGGSLCTFAAGTTTPAITYAEYTLTTPNPTCVPIDAAGRAGVGGGGVFLGTTVYKFVLKDAASVIIWTQDGISAAVPQVGGQAWTTTSGTIVNGPAGTRVCVSTSGTCTALALLNIQGASSGSNYLLRIDDSSSSPGINLYGAGTSMGALSADSAGLRLRTGAGTSQMLVADGNVTIQNAGSGSTTLTVQAGFAQGATNLLNVLSNGGTQLAYIDANGRFVGSLYNAISTSDAEFTFKNANDKFLVNGMGDLTISGGLNATGANGNAPYKVNGVTMVDAAGNATFTTLTCTDSPCGSGGGGGGSPVGVTNSIQIKASGTTFGGDANFTYTPGSGIVQLVGAGYMTSHGGFLADGVAPNIIQAPNGGVAGKWLTASDSIFLLEEAAPAAPAAGQSKLYMDSTSKKVLLSQNGGTFFNLATTTGAVANGDCAQFDGSGNLVSAGGACTTGGGGGTVASATTKSVGYYTATGTTVGGSTSFTWDNATKQMAITSTSTAVPAITVTSGYIAADGGFATTSAATNSIQAPNGGVASKWLYTSDSLILAEEAAPALSGAGQARLYADSASHTLKLSQNGSTYAVLGSGSGSGVSSITGTANQVIANVSTGAVILSLPQSIATTSPVVFASVIAAGAFNSQATGSAIAFQTANFNLQADGNGNISAAGQVNLSGGASAYKMGGVTVVDQFRNATVNNLTISGTCSGCGSGGGGVTSLFGTPQQVIVSNSTGAVTLSLPQSISTSSTPIFGGVIAGAFNSTAGGSGIAFQTSNFNLQMDGLGNISAAGQVNLTGGGSAYKMGGTTMINALGQFTGNGVNVGSNGISAGGYNVAGGFNGQNWTLSFSTPFAINGGGSYTQLYVRGGVIVSATP